MKILNTAITLTTLISTISAGYLYLDSRYALAEDHKKLEQKVDIKLTILELETLYQDMLKELYFNKDLLRKYPKDSDLIEKVAELEKESGEIKQRIKDLKAKVHQE